MTDVVRLSPGDMLRLGLIGVRVRRMRAALSALGICIGIATMIVVTGIPASSQQALLAQLTALGTNLLQAQPQPNQTPPVVFPAMVEFWTVMAVLVSMPPPGPPLPPRKTLVPPPELPPIATPPLPDGAYPMAIEVVGEAAGTKVDQMV